ncbi:MAG: bifunctional UDP-N-acetylglucosamine diphosphorylase/glucosamine-1-phosphate N-acetyltransferase GlmU [Microbacteriaceae bacterium]|nr:bifunctional UDP-N-acetylglucosamine diphosphorylase/glucosamine-1-phosphate N-acetyltransferase GlmU [Microbacteriaceae bacterium]MDR9444183.1 bifunctional UDP-N-acetylglucosamine diphosphorylase/glucosamine-1-phosphate N-acetyltransferase GlmU [Microbacteriaceae bacterium]
MNKHLAVVVLAAGNGTRMKSSTPKVLHQLAGLTLIEHVLATARALQPARLVTVLKHQQEKIEQALEGISDDVEFITQSDMPGTGAAVESAMQALTDFKGAVVVLSGDVPLMDVQTLNSLVDTHIESKAKVSLLTATVDNPEGYGRVIQKGKKLSIIEDRDCSEEQLKINQINAGVYVFDSDFLASALKQLNTNNSQSEKYLTDVVSQAEEVSSVEVIDNWLVAGINDRVQLSEVAHELNSRIIKAWQLSGVTVIDPSSTWLDVTVQLGEDVAIEPNVQLRGSTSIGTASTVGSGSVITDAAIGSNVSIKSSDITSSVIDDRSSVGPFAFLRAGTRLSADGKIGAFVETKNSIIGQGSKVPHLTYVGDAVIGEGVNIGAGTIFANYDGVNKHKTVVGDHVKTGAGNVFVAPVTINSGSYTAAGTVIRKDVKSGDLAMNHSPQRAIAGWVLANRPDSLSAKQAKGK